MMRFVRAREDNESGVVLIIFAIAMVVLLGLIAIAIDGSYGFVQNRRAQNATDFAAFAAAQQLDSSAYCSGTAQPSGKQITAIIQNLVSANGSGIGTSWTAQFLDSQGSVIPIATSSPTGSPNTFSPSNYPATPPPGACGVSVNATPSWTPFFAGVLGITHLKGNASGRVGDVAHGNPVGILALNKAGPHEILGGGTGAFVVSGDIWANTDVTNQPWTGSYYGYEWDDAIDAKTNSNLYVYGTINTIDSPQYNGEYLWPLDHCFNPFGLQWEGPNPPPSPPSPSNPNPSQSLPTYQLSCGVAGGTLVTVDYDNIALQPSQISDPLLAPDAPPNPLVNVTPCPGSQSVQYFNSPIPQNTPTLSPGVYTTPVELTGSVTFQDCPGGYPGVYQFKDGLWINPQTAGDSVTGTNVVIATGTPYPVAGNVPGTLTGGVFSATGSGNGAPCLPPSTTSSAADGAGGNPEAETSSSPSAACGGTSPTEYGVLAYHDTPVTNSPDTTMTGTGDNFSLMIGGVAHTTVSLTGPTTGAYGGTNGATGLVLYQDPGTVANYGFDAETGDAADINVSGVLYNASLSNYGANAPQDYWDGEGGGIPFYSGGTLQTGFGAGFTTGPTKSGGSVQVNGTAVVDDFNTDGATTITILGQPYSLPGGGILSLIG